MLLLLYDSETMLWREKERSRFRAEQIDKFRGLLGIRRMRRVASERIKELYGVSQLVWVDKRIAESVLQWLGHIEGIENK